MQAIKSRRIVIVGGGIVGCATAYQLARAGFTVSIIERDAIGAHASGSNAGNLNPLHGTSPDLLPFALASYRLHTSVREDLVQLGYACCIAPPVNRLHLGCNETDRAHLLETSALFNSVSGFSSAWLNEEELRRIEPRLQAKIAFGILTTGGLAIDSYNFTSALAQAAVQFGASVMQAKVLGIAASGTRTTAVRTDHGLIPCDDVVFATGPWVADTESWLAINIPVEPVKGELLLLEMRDDIPDYDVTFRSTCLYRRGQNEVWLGGTMDKCGFDATPTSASREFLLTSAAELLPSIRRASVLRHVAALRPVTRSNAPIASAAAGWENVYLANGGGAKGVLLSVGIARTICDLLLYGHSNFPPAHLPN